MGVLGRKWVMAMDLAKCDSCGKCSDACSKMHFIPPDRQWIKVLRIKDSELTAPYYFPQPCFQCDNPPCTKVCPVDATFKRLDGVILIDNDRCIGCRFCMAACPYNAPASNGLRLKIPPRPSRSPTRPIGAKDGHRGKMRLLSKHGGGGDFASLFAVEAIRFHRRRIAEWLGLPFSSENLPRSLPFRESKTGS